MPLSRPPGLPDCLSLGAAAIIAGIYHECTTASGERDCNVKSMGTSVWCLLEHSTIPAKPRMAEELR
ncbi:hypothetical protein EMIT051CA3_90049 [Pseudomonas chlororaphis]